MAQLPRLVQERTNVTRLDFDHVTVWFSYETPLALAAPGIGIIVNRDCAERSTTSAKHRTVLGFKGSPHVPGDKFARMLDNALALDFTKLGAGETMVRLWSEDVETSLRLGA